MKRTLVYILLACIGMGFLVGAGCKRFKEPG